MIFQSCQDIFNNDLKGRRVVKYCLSNSSNIITEINFKKNNNSKQVNRQINSSSMYT